MNKIINITLAGTVFSIEEDAYSVLKAYLDQLKRHFAEEDGAKEILEDIENRMAELFGEKLADGKESLNMHDVEEIMNQLGQPFEMEEPLESESAEEKESTVRGDKRLYRDPDNRLFGGVCAGIAVFMGVKSTWVRLACILLSIFSFGTVVIIYAILWFALPEARTTADKLRMRGKPVDVDNIERSIKEGFVHLRDGIRHTAEDPENRERMRHMGRQAGSGIERFFALMRNAVEAVLRVFGKTLGILLIAFCVFGIVGAVILGISGAFTSIAFSDLTGMFFISSWHVVVAAIGLFIAIVVPIVFLLLLLLRMLGNAKQVRNSTFGALLATWFVALFALAAEGAYHGLDFHQEGTVEQPISLHSPQKDRYYISFRPAVKVRSQHRNEAWTYLNESWFFTHQGKIYLRDNVQFEVTKSPDHAFRLVQYVYARGRSFETAIERAEDIQFPIEQNDSTLFIEPYLQLPENALWRNQELRLVLQVPEGKEIVFLNENQYVDNRAVRSVGMPYKYAQQPMVMRNGRLQLQGAAQKSISTKEGFTAYELGQFNRIDVDAEDFVQIEVVQGSVYQVQVLTKLIRSNDVEVQQRHSKISIDIDGINSRFPEGPHILITMPEIKQYHMEGLGKVVLRGFRQESLDMLLAGEVEGTINGHFQNLEAKMEGISDLMISGTTDYFSVEIVGASSLSAFDFIANKCQVRMEGASSAEVFAGNELDVKIHGKSSLKYKGEPIINQEVTGLSILEQSH